MSDENSLAILSKIVDMQEAKIKEVAKDLAMTKTELSETKNELKECIVFMKTIIDRLRPMENKIDRISETLQILATPNEVTWERNKYIDDSLKEYAKRIEELENFKLKTHDFMEGLSTKYQQFKLFVKYPVVTILIFILIVLALIDIFFGTSFLGIFTEKAGERI